MRSYRVTAIVAAGILAYFMITADSCGGTTEVNTSSGGSSPAASSAASGGQSPAAAAAHVGSTLTVQDEQNNKMNVTVNQIVDPAQGADQFTTPDAGKRFVAVILTIADESNQAIDEDPNNDTSIIGSDGQSYSSDIDSLAGCTNFNDGQLQEGAGESTKGCVAFQVPTGVTVSKVKFSPSSGFSGNFAEWLVP